MLYVARRRNLSHVALVTAHTDRSCEVPSAFSDVCLNIMQQIEHILRGVAGTVRGHWC
jgi:hypothetical protein